MCVGDELETCLLVKWELCSRNSTFEDELFSLVAAARARPSIPNPMQIRSYVFDDGFCNLLAGGVILVVTVVCSILSTLLVFGADCKRGLLELDGKA